VQVEVDDEGSKTAGHLWQIAAASLGLERSQANAQAVWDKYSKWVHPLLITAPASSAAGPSC
jgi:hypothetical protein